MLKYHQRLEERLELADDQRALLTLLLLRGPQAPGELRPAPSGCTRSPTATRSRPACAGWPSAEAAGPRAGARAGRQDARWVHLLGPAADAAVAAAAGSVDRRACSPTGARRGTRGCGRRTTRWPEAYADQFVNELAGMPFERWLLDRVAAHADGGPVVEVGCGPGHMTAYLADAGRTPGSTCRRGW